MRTRRMVWFVASRIRTSMMNESCGPSGRGCVGSKGHVCMGPREHVCVSSLGRKEEAAM